MNLDTALDGSQPPTVFAVTVSTDGRWLVAGTSLGFVHVWESATGRPVLRFRAHVGGVSALAVDPQSNWLVTAGSGGRDRTIRRWDLVSGVPLGDVRDPSTNVLPPQVWPVAVDGLGRVLALLGLELHVWETDGTLARHLGRFDCDGKDVSSFSIDPTSRYVATGHTDGTVTVRNLRTMATVRDYPGHNHRVTTIAWCSAGRCLASGSEEGDAILLFPVGSR